MRACSLPAARAASLFSLRLPLQSQRTRFFVCSTYPASFWPSAPRTEYCACVALRVRVLTCLCLHPPHSPMHTRTPGRRSSGTRRRQSGSCDWRPRQAAARVAVGQGRGLGQHPQHPPHGQGPRRRRRSGNYARADDVFVSAISLAVLLASLCVGRTGLVSRQLQF